MSSKKTPTPTAIIYPANYLIEHHTISSDYTHLVTEFDSPVSVYDRHRDLKLSINHLLQFSKSLDTMSFYRTELNRFLNWAWLVSGKSVCNMTRDNMIDYLDFAIFPPAAWISSQTDYAFIDKGGYLSPNPKWRPFLENESNAPAQGTIETIFSRLSAFYATLVSDCLIDQNPIQAIRQKSRFKRKGSGIRTPKVITDEQIRYCIDVCNAVSDEELDDESNNARHYLQAERALFAFSIGLSMYLRVSEFVMNDIHSPTHRDFWRDSDQNWWLKVVGKGVKERDIPLSDESLKALVRFRRVLDLADFPIANENTPLLPSVGNDVWDNEKGWITKLVPLKDTLTVWKIFRWVFSRARAKMIAEGKVDDAYELLCASSHWLRHTGISNDLQHRPADHVREDAGHNSTATTWSYSQSTNRARAESKISRG